MLRTFSDTGTLHRAAAYHILSLAWEALGDRETFSLVLSGGQTPLGTYRELLQIEGDWDEVWDRLHFYWGDERYVPHDDPRSNYRGAQRALLRYLPIGPEQVHPVPTDLDDPDEAARSYEKEMPARPDLMLAGLGEDGHTLSLFPGSPALAEESRRVVAVEAPAEPPTRITCTPPVVQNARNVLVLAHGEEKAEAVGKVLAPEGDINETPGRLLRDAEWFVDREATGRLGDGAQPPTSS
jgi:6-phosphogluconolactonase